MSHYILRSDPDNYDALVLTNKGQWGIFDQFTGKSLKNSWKLVSMEIFKVGKHGDFPYLISYVPVLSKVAWQVLEPLIGATVEALPLIAANSYYYAINVLTVLDCLDHQHSKIEFLPDGSIMYIDQYFFLPGSTNGHNIFKVQDAELKDVLVSQAFKDLVEKNHLDGFNFVRV